jgi:glycosyltransferase involved in cell wall biosynthesis
MNEAFPEPTMRIGRDMTALLPSAGALFGCSTVRLSIRKGGLGFPPLEAMACGVLVVASQSSSLVENLQGVAELVSPSDGQALTDAIAAPAPG